MAKAKKEAIASNYEYDTTKVRDKAGKLISSRGNGDAVAKAFLVLRAVGGEIDSVISANKLADKMKSHMKKPEGLKRMTLGIMLRALVNAGTPVKIGKTVVEKLNQKVDVPVEGKAVPKPRQARKAKEAKPRRARKAKGDQESANPEVV